MGEILRADRAGPHGKIQRLFSPVGAARGTRNGIPSNWGQHMRSACIAILLTAFFSGTVLAATPAVDPNGEYEMTEIRAAGARTIDAFLSPQGIREQTTSVDPGAAPEGDYLGWIAFTPDGSRVLMTNRLTDNVTVYDWSTMQPLANIPVGRYPSGLAVTGAYAVVACAFSDRVDVIDLETYVVVASIPTGEQPWVVRASADGGRAYVACDISNTCEVIDLESLSAVASFPDFPIGLTTISWNSESGRNAVTFSNFELTPDGGHIVAGDLETSVLFMNTTTGAIDYTVPNIPNCYSVALSGDGTKVVAMSDTNPIVMHQIDIATHAETGNVSVTGYYYGMTYDIAVNQDGSKAFLSVSNNSSALVRFPTSNFKTFTSTYSPFWIGVTPDHRYAISGQFYFSVIDMQTETMVGQYAGNTQSYGAVSPAGARVASNDPTRHEGIYFYDVTVPSAPAYRGTTSAGADPEGDAPRRVAITPDGGKALCTNVLSDNLTIVDVATYQVEAILPIGDRVQDVAVTSDSRWAVVCGFNTNSVMIVDLATDAVAAEVPTGTRPSVVSIRPGDDYAYVGCISSNTVSVIHLAGAASARVAEVPCGEIGIVWADYGVWSGVRASPAGNYVLIAVSFDDQVKILDTATNTIVSTLAVGDFPLEIAMNADGQYAIVTNYFGNSYTVIRVNGAFSTVVGTFSRGVGPLRLAYNPILVQTGIGHLGSETLANVDPVTGALINTVSYAAYGGIDQVLFRETGEAIVLTASGGADIPPYLHAGATHVALPAEPCTFDYCAAAQKAAVVMPGPDWLTVVNWNTAGAPETVTIRLSAPGVLDPPRPNPAGGDFSIGVGLERAGDVAIDLIDASGRRVESLAAGVLEPGRHAIDIDAGSLAPGAYFAVLRLDGMQVDRKKIVVAR